MTDEVTTASALIRQALIHQANTVYRLTATEVQSLIDYTESHLGDGILNHPAFPVGVLIAWAKTNGFEIEETRHGSEADRTGAPPSGGP